jgi:hypothetical protein
MTIKTNELVPKSLQIGNYRYFRGIKLMQRTLIVHWNGGENMNPCFQLLFSLLVKSLGLWDYKIEIEKIFSLVGILTNLKRCRLKIDNLDNLIFIKKI